MDKYINLFTDFGFKKVFGEEPNKDLLISFLNTLLPAKHQIAELEYSRNEWQGVSSADRKAIFDLHCKSQDGTYFLVELQKAKQNWFKDRSLYYASFPIQEQGKRGDWDFRLQAVYTVGILDFNFDEADKNDVIHTVQLKNQKNQVFYDKLTFIYLTLPNFRKPLAELDSLQDKWLFLFRHLAELVAFKPQEQAAYQSSLKYYRDLKNVTDTAFDEGMQQGIEQGIAQGIEQGIAQGIEQGIEAGRSEALLATARQLKQMGLAAAQIAAATGLTIANIENLSIEPPSN